MATTTTTEKPEIRIKLLVDPNTKKVLFAEAKKDFVDFLFGLLEVPLGGILSLTLTHGTDSHDTARSGSLAKLYNSVKNLDNEYLQSNKTKNSLVETSRKLLAYYPAFSSSSSSGFEGHVKGAVTYIVMDDLEVKPMSAISSVSLLNRMGVKDIGSLLERTVVVDIYKGSKLMRASFGSTTVLTDVFVPTMYFPDSSKRKWET